MNLLTEAWIPVRRHDGGREWIGPDQLSRPDLAAFDANRADFNGALAQFAIGLLQTAYAPASEISWDSRYESAPEAATLRAAFAPHAAAFELDAEGARFMQDLSLGADDGSVCEIAALLIESPGENTIRNNADHFVKRERVPGICPHCAALALFTLQLNAPSGGAGHRTSVRGGGPLTTLVQAVDSPSLWHTLWANVRPDKGQDEAKAAPHFTFPWLIAQEKLQKDGGELAPAAMHPHHIYWTMPRRIRLDFANCGQGTCAICARPDMPLLTSYRTKNYGLNYKGPWRHPLSPYYELKGDMLPLHPQPGGLGYRHWQGWVLGVSDGKRHLQAAPVVERFFREREISFQGQMQLWTFGYDMDNMKARCWYEAHLPLYNLATGDAEQRNTHLQSIEAEVGYLLNCAESAASLLRLAVREAWFERDARGDFEHVNAAFWSSSEEAFYRQLQALIQGGHSAAPDALQAARKAWLQEVGKVARHLFDRVIVGSADVCQEDPSRIARAWRKLCNSLNGPKIHEAAGVPKEEKTEGKSTKGSKKSKQTE